MPRATLIAILALAQGIPSLASSLTLCLHSDGGYCLESWASDCCGHHESPAVADQGCCGLHDDHPDGALAIGIGQSSCDCTHVALLNPPQLSSRVRDEGRLASNLFATPSVIFISAGVAIRLDHPLSMDAGMTGDHRSKALSFLAPVMLRC